MVIALAALILIVRFYPETPNRPIKRNLLRIEVKKVIDGDTIVVAGGERVRYVGIDTPEAGGPFYTEAKERNRALVGGKKVTIEVCTDERRDAYGRILGWVYTDGTDAGAILLKEGLARTLFIPPCGLKKAEEFRRYEKEARAKGVGLWGVKGNGETPR